MDENCNHNRTFTLTNSGRQSQNNLERGEITICGKWNSDAGEVLSFFKLLVFPNDQ